MTKLMVRQITKAARCTGWTACGAVLVLLCILWSGCTTGDAAEQASGPDVITIDGMTRYGKLERPPVQYPHGLHVDAVRKEKEDCTKCHRERDDGALSIMFMQLPDSTRQGEMDLYHDNCVGCHKRKTSAGEDAGPVTCGGCHVREPLYRSTAQPFVMDRSLHYRHIEAAGEKCETCHHGYDEQTRKLVYKKGEEESCRDCHRERTEENRISYRRAAHMDCVGCHYTTARADSTKKVGPQRCEGCHDPGSLMTIKVVENPPRLKRNQPDFVLLSAAEKELASSNMRTVPFSHRDHENYTRTCRDCHHETLKACTDCHALAGREEGGGVMLEEAMHSLDSPHSCTGCHQVQKTEAQCAGCHDLMEQGRLTEHACKTCHVGPAPARLEAERSLYTSLDDFAPDESIVTFKTPADEIPDTLRIDVIEGEYEPAVMPHKKIVEKLKQYIAENKLATRFHGHEDVLCQGCHHHGAIGTKPARCENCHGKPFNEHALFKPGLYGAYHQQCLGCHTSMHIQEAGDCLLCHKRRPAQAPGAGHTAETAGEK